MSTTVVTFHLSKEAIADIISLMESTLASAQADVRDAAYLHTAAGKVLSKWLSDLGEGTECTFRSGKRLGRTYITLSAPGKKINPIDADGECVLNGNNSVQTLLANIGVAPSFQYVNGENQITLMPKRKKINPLLYLQYFTNFRFLRQNQSPLHSLFLTQNLIIARHNSTKTP